MPAGRPTDYNEDILVKANEYLINYAEHGDKIPSVEGLVRVIGIARGTAHRWAKEEGKEEFSDILANINEEQKRVLINNGLSGDFNSNITKLVLGKHGFHDRQETTHAGTIGLTDLTDEQLSARLNSIIE